MKQPVTSVQALSLLAISAAAMKTVQKECIISRVDTKADLQECLDNIHKAINSWPENLPIKGRRLTQRHLQSAQKKMEETTIAIASALAQWGDLEYSMTRRNKTAVLLTVCERALWDLYDRLSTKLPRMLINRVRVPLQRLWAVEGKDGALFSVYDEAGAMIDQLQKIIGWEEL